MQFVREMFGAVGAPCFRFALPVFELQSKLEMPQFRDPNLTEKRMRLLPELVAVCAKSSDPEAAATLRKVFLGVMKEVLLDTLDIGFVDESVANTHRW